MRIKLALALFVLGVCVAPAAAVDVTDVRATKGPMGAKREDNKYLPGDMLFLYFEIKDLQLDPKDSMAAKYQTTLEILDKEGKVVFKEQTPMQKIILLGGTQIRSNAFAVLGTGQEAGKFKARLTVNDVNANQKKEVFHEFEVLPAGFGLIQPNTPAVWFAGLDYTVSFSLVGMKRNKDKLPDVNMTLSVLDEAGKSVLAKPWEFNVQIFHTPPGNDLTIKDVAPVVFTFFLNKAGTYTIQVDAVDEISKEKRQMKFPLKVLDLNDQAGK